LKKAVSAAFDRAPRDAARGLYQAAGRCGRCKSPFSSREDVSVAALLPFFAHLLTTHPGTGPAKHPPNLSMEAV